MQVQDFISKLVDIAKNYKTLYVMGCFGAPMTDGNKTRYCNNYAYNKQADRTRMIKAASADTFGFDCVCLIKGVLWGWSGDKSKAYGGAVYKANGVPDIGADQMINVCRDVSADFTGIVPGEAVWMSGHIGVYIGDNLVVECSPKWDNCVQITALGNLGGKAGYNTRTWVKHGKIPYVDYTARPTVKPDVVHVAGAWAAKSWSKACAKGIFDGTYPQHPLTREQAAVVLDRLGLIDDV